MSWRTWGAALVGVLSVPAMALGLNTYTPPGGSPVAPLPRTYTGTVTSTAGPPPGFVLTEGDGGTLFVEDDDDLDPMVRLALTLAESQGDDNNTCTTDTNENATGATTS